VTDRIQLSADLSLPLEFTTESTAILAVRRAGKSHTAKRLAEQLHAAGQQIVVVDPKGDWWGLRSAADGKAPGIPIVIVGGEHGDVPLEPAAGELVARMVVEQAVSVVLDLSQLRKHQVAAFMTAFLETLYRLKAQEKYRTPMSLIVDEADAIAPQKPYRGEERMLGAIEDCVRRGGQRGIGVVLISQRAAVLNKNVLTQCGILILLRTSGSQDIDAINLWIEKHGQDKQRKKVMATIASLPRGDAWVWAPGWPDQHGIFVRIHVAGCWTFDSGATPAAGKRRVMPKRMADVDLEAFRREMAETIERAKAEDPKELRLKIVALERDLAAARRVKVASVPTTEAKRVEVPVLKDGQLARAEKLLERFGAARDGLDALLTKAADAAGSIEVAIARWTTRTTPATSAREARVVDSTARGAVSPTAATGASAPISRYQKTSSGGVIILKAQQQILNAAAFLETIGRETPDVVQLALVAGLSATGGYWRASIGRLRSLGLIDGTRLTDAGRMYAQAPDISTVDALHRHVYTNLLEGAQRQILRVLIEQYPAQLDADEVGRRAQLEPSGGYWRASVGRLRSLGLITKKGPLAALPVLFFEDRR